MIASSRAEQLLRFGEQGCAVQVIKCNIYKYPSTGGEKVCGLFAVGKRLMKANSD